MEYKTYDQDPTLALEIRRKLMCQECENITKRVVFKKDQTIAYYFGKRVGFDSKGPYIVGLSRRKGALNARYWGGIIKFANGAGHGQPRNARFKGGLKQFGSRYGLRIVATKDIYEHGEVILDYGGKKAFDPRRDCLSWKDEIVPFKM